jgi:pyruvate kinase
VRLSKYFKKRTKIVATIGPATNSASIIEQLTRAGMNVARLNLAHGTYQEHARYIRTVRNIARRLQVLTAILIDLPGPKYRIGGLKDGSAILKKGAEVVLTTEPIEGDASRLPINFATLPQLVKAGDKILVDDGAMQLRVKAVSGNEVNCRVITGGKLTPNRGLVVPGMRDYGHFTTEKTGEHIAFAVGQQPDYIALSFVRREEDIAEIRTLLRQQGSEIPIIAKIERKQAVTRFDRILEASDGVMVARGDLGVDLPIQKIPLVQKEIIKKCNQAAKPVITATQMLESMITSVRPTRAEVTDVANAIFDGSDAIMLSAETSVGKHPVEAVRMMAKITREVEGGISYENILAERSAWLKSETDELISYNACHIASRLRAAAIVAFTQSGSTAQRVSKYRPRAPVLALTSSEPVSRRLTLYWGVRGVKITEPTSLIELFATAARHCKELGLAKAGELIVITGGIPIGIAGTTNLLKIERIT